MISSAPRRKTDWIGRVVKPLLFLAGLAPLTVLVLQGYAGTLSANPIADITNATGIWTLRFIVVTLSVTPVRRLTGWSGVARLRRMMGLFAFFYATLHFTTYVYLDKFFDFSDMVDDVVKRKFILIGFATFVTMIPLALTSTDGATRWLGGKRWQLLHRLVYLIGIGGVVHFLWRVKADHSVPLTYGAIVCALLGYRLWVRIAPVFGRWWPKKAPAVESQ